jgi:hypothetical protein
MDVSQPRTLRYGREIGTLTSSALLNDLSMFTVVHRDYTFPDFALLSVDPTTLNPLQYCDHIEFPTTYNEAWNHLCAFQHKLWQEAINVEIVLDHTVHIYG